MNITAHGEQWLAKQSGYDDKDKICCPECGANRWSPYRSYHQEVYWVLYLQILWM